MKLKNTSASQVTRYRFCPRAWYNESILKIQTPTNKAAQFGTDTHALFQNFVAGGKIPPTSSDADIRRQLRLLDSAKSFIPAPSSDGVLLEQGDFLETPTGIPWKLYIDLVEYKRSPIRITDYKTKGDLRYAKTSNELLRDTQMVSYAMWAFREFSTEEVEIRHLYLQTKGKPVAHPVSALATIENIKEQWESDQEIVSEQKFWAEKAPSTAEELTPNTNSCNRYGPCPHQKLCKINQGEFDMSLLDKWKQKQQEQQPKTNGAATEKPIGHAIPEAQQKEPIRASEPSSIPSFLKPSEQLVLPTLAQGVVPSDAPSRDEKVVLSSEETAPKRKGRPKKAQEAATSVALKHISENTKSETAAGFSLYIDCVPLKGGDGYVLFEDFIRPYTETIAQSQGIQDYRLLKYGEWKAPLANLLRETPADQLPDAIVIDSFTSGAKEALEVMVPIAERVVRKLG